MAFGLSAGAVSLIGAGAGLLAGGQSSKQTQTADKSPWEPAQPWIKSNLATGQDLQSHYQQNPFNAQQKTGYQNLFSGVDNFNQNMAPGLMNFANQGMTQSYQRQRGGAPGSMAGYGGAVQPGGLLGNGMPGAFSAPRSQSFGLLNLDDQNPFKAGGTMAVAQLAREKALAAELERQRLAAIQAAQYNYMNMDRSGGDGPGGNGGGDGGGDGGDGGDGGGGTSA